MDKMTAIERLEALLNEKDEEIEKEEARADAAEERLAGIRGGWMVHVTLPAEQSLPVPRLEVVYDNDGDETWREYVVIYRLVYRHFLGHCVGVPLGKTTIRGGVGRAPIFDGKVDLPFRDGQHIRSDARHLSLPAFAICGAVVDPIAPLAADPEWWGEKEEG